MAITAGFAAAFAAYSRSALVDDVQGERSEFGLFDRRLARYDILWALYENTAYDEQSHPWAASLKADRGLYKGIGHILNPIHRLVDFHEGHIWGGVLDPRAGDEDTDSCLPIVTTSDTGDSATTDAIRAEIARLWADSKWQRYKDMTTRLGSALGEVGLEVVDDLKRGKVYLRPVHPRKIADLQVGPDGLVEWYELTWRMPDPRVQQVSGVPPVLARYTEVVTLEYPDVVHRTYIDDYQPYSWATNPVAGAEWAIPYGFVPFVFLPHMQIDPDSPWGWAEGHAGLSKVFAVDDVSSLVQDWIRRASQNPKAINTRNPAANADPVTRARNPEVKADETNILYLGNVPDVSVFDLTTTLPVKDIIEFERLIMEEFERHYPELQVDPLQPSIDISGIALEIAQRRAQAKVRTRRAIYDDALTTAIEMSRAVGAYRGYKGYGLSSLQGFIDGPRAFAIGNRDVFEPLPSQQAQQRLQNAQAMTEENKSLSLVTILERDGWTPDQIDRALAEKAADAQQAVAQAGAVAQATAPPQPQQPPAPQPQQGAA